MSITSLFAQMSPYYSDRHYYNSPGMEAANDPAYTGFLVFAFVFILIISVVLYVVMALLLSRIFKKAGVEGWKAWVPIYNNWTFIELGGQKGYWAVLAIIPVVNIVASVFMFIAMYHIGLNFGKEGAFVLLAIFLPLVWFIWLAVDDSIWKSVKPQLPTSPNKTLP